MAETTNEGEQGSTIAAGTPSDRVVSSTQVEVAGAHERVSVWNRGGLAGVLVVQGGDGATVAELLAGRSGARALAVAGGVKGESARAIALLRAVRSAHDEGGRIDVLRAALGFEHDASIIVACLVQASGGEVEIGANEIARAPSLTLHRVDGADGSIHFRTTKHGEKRAELAHAEPVRDTTNDVLDPIPPAPAPVAEQTDFELNVRDVIDDACGLQPVMTNDQVLTFLSEHLRKRWQESAAVRNAGGQIVARPLSAARDSVEAAFMSRHIKCSLGNFNGGPLQVTAHASDCEHPTEHRATTLMERVETMRDRIAVLEQQVMSLQITAPRGIPQVTDDGAALGAARIALSKIVSLLTIADATEIPAAKAQVNEARALAMAELPASVTR